MFKQIDALIVVISIACAAFAAGIWVGQAHVQQVMATKCVAQPGEKLSSVEQRADSVVCVYAQFPMRAKEARRAT